MGDFNRGGFNRGKDRGGFRNSHRDDRGERRNREDREMFDAICSKCGKPFKLPFFPKTDKPVFCDSCFQLEKSESRRDGGFSRGRDRGSSNTSNASNEKLDLLISKMDEVLGLLKQKTEEKLESKKVKVEKEEKKQKVKKEKVEKKKTTKKVSKK